MIAVALELSTQGHMRWKNQAVRAGMLHTLNKCFTSERECQRRMVCDQNAWMVRHMSAAMHRRTVSFANTIDKLLFTFTGNLSEHHLAEQWCSPFVISRHFLIFGTFPGPERMQSWNKETQLQICSDIVDKHTNQLTFTNYVISNYNVNGSDTNITRNKQQL